MHLNAGDEARSLFDRGMDLLNVSMPEDHVQSEATLIGSLAIAAALLEVATAIRASGSECGDALEHLVSVMHDPLKDGFPVKVSE